MTLFRVPVWMHATLQASQAWVYKIKPWSATTGLLSKTRHRALIKVFSRFRLLLTLSLRPLSHPAGQKTSSPRLLFQPLFPESVSLPQLPHFPSLTLPATLLQCRLNSLHNFSFLSSLPPAIFVPARFLPLSLFSVAYVPAIYLSPTFVCSPE